MFDALMQRCRCLVCGVELPPVSRRPRSIVPAQLCSALSTLGCVLYLPMPTPPNRDALPAGLLADSPDLLTLLRVTRLVAASVITTDGPREWVECVDRHGRECARLYLLPDTDYLAWDALLNGNALPAPVVLGTRAGCDVRPLSAQCVRFSLRRLGGLSVLGCSVTAVSSLGVRLARQVAGAEIVRLRRVVES